MTEGKFDLDGSGPFYGYINVYRTGQDYDANRSNFHYDIGVGCYTNGWGTFGANGGWSFNSYGFSRSGGLSLDFRPASTSARMIIVASGDFQVGHDGNGYAGAFDSSFWIDTDHASIYDGGGSVREGAPPRIPQRPYAPVLGAIDNIRSNSFGLWYTFGDDRGAAIDKAEVQWSRNPEFTNLIWTDVNSFGYSNPNNIVPLTPATEYWVRARTHNSRGWSDWSSSKSARTLSGAYRWNGTLWIPEQVITPVQFEDGSYGWPYSDQPYTPPSVQVRNANNTAWQNAA